MLSVFLRRHSWGEGDWSNNINQAHMLIGLFGQSATSQYIWRYYWWPSMGTDIKLFCSSCTLCQAMRDSNQKLSGLLHSLPIPDQLWQLIGMDFMCPLAISNAHDYLLVVIDWFTSELHLIPTMTQVTMEAVTWLFLRDIVRLHGVPEPIMFDQDVKFTSKFWKELHWLLGTKLLMSTAFHLQMDGVTKRTNCSIAQVLQTLHNSQWPERLGHEMPSHWVCTQQQCQCNDQICPIWVKLRAYPPTRPVTEHAHTVCWGQLQLFA